MMRIVALVFAISISYPSLVFADNFEGAWFKCLPDMAGRPSPYEQMEIKRQGNKYSVFSEWGQLYTFSGWGFLKDNKLIVKGCTSYRGEVRDNCDVNKPPVARKLDKQALNQTSIGRALLKSKYIRIDSRSEDELEKRCEDLINPSANI
jgi:hypothetical protein